LKPKFDSKTPFLAGGIDVSELMPYGTKKRLKEESFRQLRMLAMAQVIFLAPPLS